MQWNREAMGSFARLLGMCTVAVIAAPAFAGASIYRWVDANGVVNYSDRRPGEQKKARRLDEEASRVSILPAPSAEELTRQRIFLLERRLGRLEEALREPRPAVSPVVMLGSPQPPLFATTWWTAGWWGAPVVRPRGWHARPFPPHPRPPHMRPLPQPISSPMRFQNPRVAAGRAPHR
jgi:hypothetical protein